MAVVPHNSFQALDRAEWRSWLQKNHERREGIWLITFKKNSGHPTLSYEEQVEEALCFGWVDSLGRKLDERRTMLWFAPRKVTSNWSALNKRRVEKLTRAGLMMPAGLAKVATAKKNGTWTALDEVESLMIPADLLAELEEYPQALGHFEAFPRSVKRAILEWILNAKKAETRTKRIQETASLAAKNIRANQWRQS